MFKSIIFITLCTFALSEGKLSHQNQRNRLVRQIPPFDMNIPSQLANAASGTAGLVLKTIGGLTGGISNQSPPRRQDPQLPQMPRMPEMSGMPQILGR